MRQKQNLLFFSEPSQRATLARERFFDEGERPTGLVGEQVLQSWMRCCALHRQSKEAVSFEPVSSSRAHRTLARSQALLQASGPELGHLELALGGTGCRVLLINDQGVIIHVSRVDDAVSQPLLHAASRVGVNLAEERIGTSAPGIVVRTGLACTVIGPEHFFDGLQALHCAAAPIRDIHGQVAGVLDISVEGRTFSFDAGAVVNSYVTTIENRLLLMQSSEHLVLRFQVSPSLLGTSLEALGGIDSQGRLVWLNAAARRLTGCEDPANASVLGVFGATPDQLLPLSRKTAAQTWRLPNGLGIWICGRAPAADASTVRHAVPLSPANGADVTPAPAPHPASTPASPATFQEHSLRVIEETLSQHDGNIARTARALGVSRGMLYRRLKRARVADTPL